MEPIILESAHRHGVADEDMLHAFAHPLYIAEVQPNGTTMAIGPARNGRPLELGYKAIDGGLTVIFHAMPARKKYL